MRPVVLVDFQKNNGTSLLEAYTRAVGTLLNRLDAAPVLEKEMRILLKPNLVNASPFPVTTSPIFCEAVIDCLRQITRAELIIAEGCGDIDLETADVFNQLGYTDLSKKKDIRLIDLNHEPLRTLSNPQCDCFPEMHLPEIAFESFIVSLPVLKAHSLADVTGTLKNMMGFAPPQYYQGQYGTYKKAVFHGAMHQSITDLNRYRRPDLSIMDATIGLAEYHLGGPMCDPPVKKIIGGFDPYGVDQAAAQCLHLDWKKIPHIFPVKGSG